VIGELMLEVALAHLSDTDTTDLLAPPCEAIARNFKHGPRCDLSVWGRWW